MIIYRYDDELYDDNSIVRSRGDHFDTLTASEKQVEAAIRAVSANASDIRRTSLYTWADEAMANRLWKLSRKKYLYYLAVDESNVRHKGDVNCYSLAGDAIAGGASPDNAIKKYWSGENAGPCYATPRVEVLVSHATVRKRFSR
jgi:hypothetical protein